MPSSVIDHFRYQPESATLRVTFVSGTVYDYKAVPKAVFEKMNHAQSKGKFLNRYIKGKYRFEKVVSG